MPRLRSATLAATAIALAAVLAPSQALGSKQVIASFGPYSPTGAKGGEFGHGIGDIAVNSTGAGPAERGEIYVADPGNHRLQRFAQNDNGTPADPYDDRYEFVAAWGVGVQTGGSGYEICTVADTCRSGLDSGANGGIGTTSAATGAEIAVDQDTGIVYLFDEGNHRISVYSGEGTFLRSFGYDVVASGPDDSGTGYEVCIVANGDVCKAGTAGTGIGQLPATESPAIAISQPDGNPATGTLYVGVGGFKSGWINTYALDGSGPVVINPEGHFTAARSIAVDSRGILYIGDKVGETDIDRYDTQGANGSVGWLAPIPTPPVLPSNNNGSVSMEVDPDSDGPGPESDILFVLRTTSGAGKVRSVVQQFGPAHPPGLTVPPGTADDLHGDLAGFTFVTGLGLDSANGRLFVSSPYARASEESGEDTLYVLDTAGGAPAVTLDSIDGITATAATAHATVNPNGGPPVSVRLEYSTDGAIWSAMPETTVGAQETPQDLTLSLDPPGGGLEPNSLYHVRLRATKAFAPPVISEEKTFTTGTASPLAETVGSPLRSATTVRFEGRVSPRGSTTSYHFEYGSEGPCDLSPCQSTAPVNVGSGEAIAFVSQGVGGLDPGTTYHYRLIAENASGTSAGGDSTATTRASDQPLSHGSFPGPAGSDRAWEQVNIPETGGNPVIGGLSFSDDGERVIYQIPGGTPATDTGSAFGVLFAERTAAGWQSRQLFPPRDELAGPNWLPPAGSSELSNLFAMNLNVSNGESAFWRLSPNGSAVRLGEMHSGSYGGFFTASDDGSRGVIQVNGTFDPDHPVPAGTKNLYDMSSGSPKLVSLLPGEAVAPCGVEPSQSAYKIPDNGSRRTTHWLSADGRFLVFPSKGATCSGQSQLFLRDIPAESTARISPPPLSGPDCGAGLIKQTPGAVFFFTRSRLVSEDSSPDACPVEGNYGDVYRYDIGDGTVACVTCFADGRRADVAADAADPTGFGSQIVVSEDGGRIYFTSPNRLLPGAQSPGIYRLRLADGDLAYVSPAATAASGDGWPTGNAVNPDGAVFVFRSKSPLLDQVNGAHNGGTLQYYRYDDRDRSLVCMSCPADGTAAASRVSTVLATPTFTPEVGPNANPLDDSGQTFVFATPVPLVEADQNTPSGNGDPRLGTDVYEWRDGRVILVSDGLTTWPNPEIVPAPSGITPDGRNIYFTASAQYTPDAIDSYNRLYDARIGGGIDFPSPPKPCPLEVCQGTPKGAPEEAQPGTATFSGQGNVSATPAASHPCRKGRVRKKGRCVKKHRKAHRRNSNHRRTTR